MFRKYAANFRTPFPNNTPTGLPMNFLELLALEIAKSTDVQLCQFILIRWNQTCFFQGYIMSKMNSEIGDKVIKKVKES